jgi:outer membrane protein assembly factor BamB
MPVNARLGVLAFLGSLLGGSALAQQDPAGAPGTLVAAPGHWPQWHGPSRDNISTEKNLVREWPAEGPPLLWAARGLGQGMSCLSVAGGLLITLGNQGGNETATALDGNGTVVWSVPLGPASGEISGMRYVTQRSPTVDNDRLYVTTWQGFVCCLESTTGRILWRKSYTTDLDADRPIWWFGDSPLLDGGQLICSPGGSKGVLAALKKESGALLWRSSELKGKINAAIVPAEIDKVPQYVVYTYERVAGIAAKTGKLLWSAECPGRTVVVTTPVVHDGIVFVSQGFNVGCRAFEVKRVDQQFTVRLLYEGRQLDIHHGGMVCIGEHLYGASDNAGLKCVELKTGNVVWQERCVGKGSITEADGMLVVRGERGPVAYVEATPEAYRERGRFEQPQPSKDTTQTHPVVAGGRLYLRDQDLLLCFDLRGKDYAPPAPVWDLIPRVARPPARKPSLPPVAGKAPDAAFVPTPQDVVEKMIELAKVTKDDVLYDLGSGDGRIVLTASRSRGCKSVGFEIHPGLVSESRQKVKQQQLGDLVTIEERDLFAADLSGATVVTLYLGAPNNAKLLPELRKLKAGSRIVSHAHLLGEFGPKPDQTVTLTSTEDHSEHTIYLWNAPLGEEKR